MPGRSKAKSAVAEQLKRDNEDKMLNDGCWIALGADEAGRGGPVVVAAAFVPRGAEDDIEEIRDSKELDEHQRESGYDKLMKVPGVVFAVEVMDEVAIDTINILAASMLGMARCAFRVAAAIKAGLSSKEGAFEAPEWPASQLDDLNLALGAKGFAEWDKPVGVLIDGPRLAACLKIRAQLAENPELTAEKLGVTAEELEGIRLTPAVGLPIIKGDALELQIAAASIFAKVRRDRLMVEMAGKYPQWNLEGHKGYPCPEHKGMLGKMTPLSVHRWSFKPVPEALVREGRLPKRVVEDVAAMKFVLTLRRVIREKGLDLDGSDPALCLAFVEEQLAVWDKQKEEDEATKKKRGKAKGKAKTKAASKKTKGDDDDDEEGDTAATSESETDTKAKKDTNDGDDAKEDEEGDEKVAPPAKRPRVKKEKVEKTEEEGEEAVKVTPKASAKAKAAPPAQKNTLMGWLTPAPKN